MSCTLTGKCLNAAVLGGEVLLLPPFLYQFPVMTLQQFRAASREVQEKLVKLKGVFLMERKSLGVSVLLFQLDGFYVEVFYNSATSTVKFIKSFNDMDGIEAYLDKIDISEVMAIL
jgi:hypothetical protein